MQNNLEVLRECLTGLSQSTTMHSFLIKRQRTRILMKYPYDREYDPYEEETNKEKYDLIRQVIFSCSSFLNAAKVLTWDEIVDFFFLEIFPV